MINLKNLLLEAGDKKHFVKSVSNINDESEFINQSVKDIDSVPHYEFLQKISLTGSPRLLKLYLRRRTDDFQFGQTTTLIWAYDSRDDIYYFFK
jgi:hypothetical protein